MHHSIGTRDLKRNGLDPFVPTFDHRDSHEPLTRPATPSLTRLPILGVGINYGSRAAILDELLRLSDHHTSAYACFVNVHMVMEANRHPDFFAMINGSDFNCPDGLPIAKGVGWFHAINQPQIAGPDTLPHLLELAHLTGKRIFVLGSTEKVLEAFTRKAQSEYGDDLIAGTLSPPFRPLTPEEDEAIVQQINETKADMIFVALGCPKQEKWMHTHRGRVHGCMFGLGYAIPVYAGIESRAPRWMIEWGLEWVFRLSSDPRRLFKRYVQTNSSFLYHIVRAKFWHKIDLDNDR